MVEELEISAMKLAQSEREEAWREMAKQVAHEIKNPLTQCVSLYKASKENLIPKILKSYKK
jgi:nitrogen fixation/metabolism regulation signal transduction histidine kinase